MILIDERLPEDRLHAEAVLHARRHARRVLREGSGTVEHFGLLFGIDIDPTWSRLLSPCVGLPDGIDLAAGIIGKELRTPGTVVLGHDAVHVERCRRWLQSRKDDEPALHESVATDLATLLVMSEAIDLATARAPSDALASAVPILIEGETGTGKELLARAIHAMWARSVGCSQALNVVHVAGLAPGLVSDELFGHVKGAYTGARENRMGRLESANGSTVLIDEVGDLPVDAQVGLLRFLQDQKLARLGSNKDVQLHVRVLAATWHDLEEDVAQKRFRLDLLHRLRVGRLRLPPLRERMGAAQSVVPAMLRRLGQKGQLQITRSARDALALYLWPGNLRELDGVLRLALASCGGGTIRLEDLPAGIQQLYLSLPLHRRAVGFLSDEVEEQPMTPELARWRADTIDAEFHRMTPPDAPPEIAAVRDFFRGIPDRSADHRHTVRALDVFVSAYGRHQLAAFVHGVWASILHAELHDALRPVVKEKERKAKEALDLSHAQLEGTVPDTMLTNSPWWRLADELRAMPFFATQDHGAVLQGIMTLVGGLYSIAPGLGKQLREMLKRGGVSAVRKRITDAIADKSQDGEDPDFSDHRMLTAADWREIVATHPSKAAAGRALRVDTKTITAHLVEHGVPENWAGKKKATSRPANRDARRGRRHNH